MFRPRIIPLLLVNDGELVKSARFTGHRYIGDPVNAARIFSELEADELLLLDISATRKKTVISSDLVRNISSEIAMPLSAGGGIRSLQQISGIISSGAEKVVIGTAAHEDPALIEAAAKEFGSTTISVCVDVSQKEPGNYDIRYRNAQKRSDEEIAALCLRFQELGAGEIILQSVSSDGMKSGYDTALIELISEKLSIPLVAAGGAGNYGHFSQAFESGASAVAAGSLFVFHGNGVLINYPDAEERQKYFSP